MIYKIPCVWQVWGIMKIKAKSLEEAINKAENEEPLPEHPEYIDDSFEVDHEGILIHNPLEVKNGKKEKENNH